MDYPRAHHPHSHPASGKKRLILALSVTGIWFLIEVAGGIYSNSLALLADAAHMLTDLAALGMSLFALHISTRPATHEKTYGYLRAEILAAFGNGIFLILIAIYILYESYQRVRTPPEVKSLPMLLVAATGLLANLVTAGLLFKSRNENLNLRGAFLHVFGDTLGSVGAILAGMLMLFRQWYLADPIVSTLVAILVLYSAWKLVAESIDVLLEGTPRHLKISHILKDLGSIRGVVSVHDLHVWSIASAMTAMSCHIVMKTEEDAHRVLAESSHLMREKYKIKHTTIQIEFESWPMHPGDTILELPLQGR
ncbi:MAG: cation diffusion facilitator family transporter [Acidobacteriota bacterium]|nr:cation diffusion facilitator family transporter [Acidobacteriota bacterium]